MALQALVVVEVVKTVTIRISIPELAADCNKTRDYALQQVAIQHGYELVTGATTRITTHKVGEDLWSEDDK